MTTQAPPVRRIDNPGLAARQPVAEPVPVAETPAPEPVAPAAPVLAAAPAEPVAPLPEDVVVLSRSYLAFGEPVSRIRLRRPVTRDIRKYGNPLKVRPDANGEADIELKWDVIAHYVAALSEPPLPPTTVDELDYFDLDACAAVIAPFFVRLRPATT